MSWSTNTSDLPKTFTGWLFISNTSSPTSIVPIVLYPFVVGIIVSNPNGPPTHRACGALGESTLFAFLPSS